MMMYGETGSTSMDRSLRDVPAVQEDAVKHQQKKKILKSLICCQFLSSGGHFVQPIGTISAILVQGHERNMPVKSSLNRATGCGGDVL